MLDLKQQFFEAIRVMYPSGAMGPIQHRDVIRVYFMGTLEGLKYLIESSNDKLIRLNAASRMREILEFMKPITTEDWMPDQSWVWWRL